MRSRRTGTIRKCAAIILREGQLLVVRKRGTSTFISPGGKVEPGESAIECLRRELCEELGVELVGAERFGTFKGVASFEGTPLEVDAWLTSVEGECSPRAEIEELRWINGSTQLPVGSIFRDGVIPALVEQGRIHG